MSSSRWIAGRSRIARLLIVLVAGALALLATRAVAGAASSPPLTATAVHFKSYPNYAQATVDFTPAELTAAEVRATDANPFDGTSGLLVSFSSVATRVSTAHSRFYGVTVRVAQVPGGLSIGIGSPSRAFLYLSYTVVDGDELVVDLWDTIPTGVANIQRGTGGCLTLSSVKVTDGRLVSARGTAHNLFQGRFRVTVRDGLGKVLATQAVSASGAWSVKLRYSLPQGQFGHFYAVATSPKDGSLACIVEEEVTLPASNPRAIEHVVYSAHADVDGTGRQDLVSLKHIGSPSSNSGVLKVTLASGRVLTLKTPGGAVWLPGLVATGNVNATPGDELFVDVQHVTTAETIWIITYWNGQLLHAGTVGAYGNDYGVVFGVTCSRVGANYFLAGHEFYLKYPTSTQWYRADTVYEWSGPTLKLYKRIAAKPITGQPNPALVGVQCGHVPTP